MSTASTTTCNSHVNSTFQLFPGANNATTLLLTALVVLPFFDHVTSRSLEGPDCTNGQNYIIALSRAASEYPIGYCSWCLSVIHVSSPEFGAIGVPITVSLLFSPVFAVAPCFAVWYFKASLVLVCTKQEGLRCFIHWIVGAGTRCFSNKMLSIMSEVILEFNLHSVIQVEYLTEWMAQLLPWLGFWNEHEKTISKDLTRHFASELQ